MMSHRLRKRFSIGAKCLLVLGAAPLAACGAPGDFAPSAAEIGSSSGETPRGGASSCPGYADPSHCPPFATGGPYAVSGVLTLRTTSGTAPLANAGIGGYVIMTSGNSYGMAPVVTDANGRYHFTQVPNGVVVLTGDAPHVYQPCAAIATVSGASGDKDFEMVDSAAVGQFTPTGSPTLSGVVYRKTDAGRAPIAGAVIEYEYSPVIAARTITDALGRYSLCHLPLGRGGLEVWLNGVSLGGRAVATYTDQVMDLIF